MKLAVSAAPSADNSQPWTLRHDGDHLLIEYEAERMKGTLFPNSHPATLLALGCVIENIHQVTEALGLRMSIETVPSSVDGIEVIKLSLVLGAKEQVSEETLLNLPLFQRHTNRFPYKKDKIERPSQGKGKEQPDSNIVLQMVDSRSEILKLSVLIRNASRVRFQTREIHDWFARTLRFSKLEVQYGDGLDVDTLGLPRGGRLLLKTTTRSWRNMAMFNRFGGYHLLASTEAASITKAGAIFAIVGPSDAESIINAGRKIQRLWIELNFAGYAVQPYYVITDQLQRLVEGTVPPLLIPKIHELKVKVGDFFKLKEGQVVHMLLRVGVPIKIPKRALRRSLKTNVIEIED